MSLVSYAASSDEEDNISDEEVTNGTDKQEESRIKDVSKNEETPLQLNLPPVKNESKKSSQFPPEEDDEFLKKKAVPEEKPPPVKGKVRIMIPSLNDFKDDEGGEMKTKKLIPKADSKKCGLLTMLPSPKSEKLFGDQPLKPKATVKSLIPDSVARKGKQEVKKPNPTVKPTSSSIVQGYESSDGEDEEDFFSLNKDEELPEISKNEIAILVAKKAAKMAEANEIFEKMTSRTEEEQMEITEPSFGPQYNAEQASSLNEEAIQNLIGGSRAKRAKISDVEFLELSHDQVMPDRDEWMRTALANSTDPLPRGEVKDGPKGLAKRKHQITYLAQQAKTNEAELQAMWAAGRQNKRQTQNKYGF